MVKYNEVFEEFFRGLSFEDLGHKYYFGEKRIKSSVSNVIKKYVEPFPEKDVSLAISKRDGISQQDILNVWDEKRQKACDFGTEVHLFAELYPSNKHMLPKNGHERAVVKFWNDLPEHIVPAALELKMYHKEKMFAGTTDVVFHNLESGSYIISDYKTNEDIFKNYKGKKLLPPFSHMLDTSFNKYQIQLSCYQILFEQTGLQVSSRKLIWLKDTGEYEIYDTEDLTKQLKEEFTKM